MENFQIDPYNNRSSAAKYKKTIIVFEMCSERHEDKKINDNIQF